MNVVLQWLARQAIAFYLVALLGTLTYVLMALAARKRKAAAQFSLEREIEQQKVVRAWLMAGLFLFLGLMVFVVTTYLVPTLPAVESTREAPQAGLTPLPTHTPTPTQTITPTLATTVEAVTDDSTPTPEAAESTATATPTPTPTPLPTAEPPNCPSPDVQITAPSAGSTLSGANAPVEIRGTAQINAFAYYKFEVQFPESDAPSFIAQFNQPVENGVLGYWDISNPESYPVGGPYRFRLVAVDIYGNTQGCVIPVYINHP
ncbi:MAG: hypothetical protein ACLFU8_10920 [Anaerolineales bacterium]